jgi:hypothetical protein
MKRRKGIRLFTLINLTFLTAATLLFSTHVRAQCPVTQLASGLQLPLGITQTNQKNLIVSESGPRGTTNTGTLAIIGLDGSRRTLLANLPSGSNDVGDPSGPAGVFMRGRTLYVAVGLGNVVIGVGIPGAAVPNPNGPSSPIFSSILAVHFSAFGENTTEGFTLSLNDQQVLAAGGRVSLENGSGDRIDIELVANFPDYIPNPLPTVPNNVRASNPFDLVAVDDTLYVTDGGRNLVWQVDLTSGAFSPLAEFAPIPNPLFNPTPPPPSIGGPVVEAVPTSIDYADGKLLVTLFRGFPFPAGTSVVEQIDPLTGAHVPFITGLRTAISVLPLVQGDDTDYLVLEHSTAGGAPLPPFGNAGRLLGFEEPGGLATVLAGGTGCLLRPTSMTLDKKTGTLYVTEYGGRVLSIAGATLSSSNIQRFRGKNRN